MIENKNIDRVFQENLKDLEIYPSSKVWKNIENHLQGKPQKRVIPLWQRVSGVAMIFLLLFSAGFGFFRSNKNPDSINNSIFKLNSNAVAEEPANQEIMPKNDFQLADEGRNIEGAEHKQEAAKKNVITPEPNKAQLVLSKNELKAIDHSSEVLAKIKEEGVALSEKGNETDDSNKKVDIFDVSKYNDDDRDIVAVVDKPKEKKWSIGPTVSPVYYNSLTKGSPISKNLENNNTTSDEALSYGVKVDYQLNKKFKIQSGVNKVELAYTTNNVNAVVSSSKSNNHTIDLKNAGLYLSSSGRPASIYEEPIEGQLSKSSIDGELNQSIEYVEIPIEMKYNLFESRLDLNLVGGFSTFILTGNQVSFVLPVETTGLGQANNLNSINFSGNLGFDLDYKINSDWFLNVTPMVKYQFNTFSNNAGNFQPYYLGVYSGINYRF